MGTNLSQVFISNALTALSGTTFNSSGNAADDVGVWKLDATAGYTTSALYDAVIAASSADSSAGDLNLVSPLWMVKDFQIVQRAVTGNFIASPIINSSQVKRVAYYNHVPVVLETNTIDIAASTITGDDIEVKFVVRTAPVDYQNFSDPGSAFNDLTGNGVACPIVITNNTNHKVYTLVSTSADRLATTAAADDELGLYDDILAKINDHGVLADLLVPTDNAGSGLAIQTRFAGVIVDVIYNNVTDGESVTATESGYVTKTAFNPGVGNDFQVIAEEKRCRSRYGNFNRMYFPNSFDQYATDGHAYDKIVIEYTHNWPNSTGIAPAGALNQAIIYYSNEGADPGTTATEFDDIFGYAIGTDVEYKW